MSLEELFGDTLTESARKRIERDLVQVQLKILFWKSMEQDEASAYHLKRYRKELKELQEML